MKLAIFGSSPIALEAALRFHHHGAAVTWFNAPEIQAGVGTTKLGWETLQKTSGEYYAPLVEFLKQHQVVRPYSVISVTKRYLAPNEQIEGSSRFYDLFRVIYQVNPEEFISAQKESNPETFERLSNELVQSLQSSLEMYEDFDVILDLRTNQKAPSIAASGRALGEGRLGSGKIHYGYGALKAAREMSLENRELAIIGSGALAAQVMIALESWMKDVRTRLFVVTTEEEPFMAYLQKAPIEMAQHLKKLFHDMEEEFEREITEFHQKLREWQALDDFVQAKKPRPAEPIPRLNYFSGHNVTAVDQLIDKRRLFLTLERPDFRNGKKHPENNLLDLKTIGVDEILSAHDLVKDNSMIQLDHGEKGFFSFSPVAGLYKEGFEKDLERLKDIEDEVFKIFTPADADQLHE